MNKTAKKLGIIALVIIWFILLMLPTIAVILASREQMQIGIEDTSLRLFLLQQADTEGLGIEFTRPSRVNSNCQQASVSYFMWVGESENVDYCLCRDQQTNSSLPAISGTCLPP